MSRLDPSTFSAAGDTEAATVAGITLCAAEPSILDPKVLYGLTVPEGADHQVLDLERHLPTPRRKIGQVTLHEGPSLVAYVLKHDEADATELFADVEHGRIVAVLNGHADVTAGWGDHRATLTLRKTHEWQHWAGASGQMLSQVAFAEHIEAGLPEIRVPEAADMLELAQSFQAHTKVQFSSANVLASGERQLVYTEETTAQAGRRGDIVIPKEFELGIAPYEGSEPYRVVARLRHRIGDGRLTLGYVLDRPEDVLRAAFLDVLSQVEQGTGRTALRGVAQ